VGDEGQSGVRVSACCTRLVKNHIAVSAVTAKGDSNAALKVGKFPRSVRLLRHADFERVYKQGRRHFSASITVFYSVRTEALATKAVNSKAHATSAIRVGFTVGRALGGAVERNRMKRRLREAVRLTRPPAGANVDIVINPKRSLLGMHFSALLNEVARAFEVIEQKVAGKSNRKSPPRAESD
jgi:ribonuclease P protein component